MEIDALKLQALEKEVQDVKKDVKEIKSTLDTLVESVADLTKNVTKMTVGLYDDDENNHKGIISKYKTLADEVDGLKKRLGEVEKVNADQEIALKAKKSIFTIAMEVIKWLALLALVAQGTIGVVDLIVK